MILPLTIESRIAAWIKAQSERSNAAFEAGEITLAQYLMDCTLYHDTVMEITK